MAAHGERCVPELIFHNDVPLNVSSSQDEGWFKRTVQSWTCSRASAVKFRSASGCSCPSCTIFLHSRPQAQASNKPTLNPDRTAQALDTKAASRVQLGWVLWLWPHGAGAGRRGANDKCLMLSRSVRHAFLCPLWRIFTGHMTYPPCPSRFALLVFPYLQVSVFICVGCYHLRS